MLVVAFCQFANASEIEQSLANKIAQLDVATLKCGDRLVLDGPNYILMQNLWRGMLLTKSGLRFSNFYTTELKTIMQDYDKVDKQESDYCVGVLIWFQMNMQNQSPFKNVHKADGELLLK
jgi:hypothetical protein